MSYLLSIIIPAYNVESTVKRTLDSVAKQSLRNNFETIVINDGSTDNTKTIIEKFIKSQDFMNIRLINKENGGVSSARNVGINEAIGDYVLFLDGDDLLHERCAESIYR